MFIHNILFVFMFFLKCNSETRQYNKEVLGLDSGHLTIDKDTVITRNMKLHSKKREDRSTEKKDTSDPHWSYSSFPAEMTSHVEQFKKNMSECLKEVQANDKRTVRRLSPKMESPVHGECLIACVLKRNGVIHNGKIHKENLIALVEMFFAKDVKIIKKLVKNLDRCIAISSKYKDECQMASQLNDCTNDLMAHNKHKVFVNY